MFDYLYVEDPNVQLKCAEGHDIAFDNEFQTKDLHCLMDEYTIQNGELWRKELSWEYNGEDKENKFFKYTGQVRFYGNCKACPTSYWQHADAGPSVLGPHRQKPWSEFIALFDDGKLLLIKPVKLETIAESKADMLRYYVEVDKEGNKI